MVRRPIVAFALALTTACGSAASQDPLLDADGSGGSSTSPTSAGGGAGGAGGGGGNPGAGGGVVLGGGGATTGSDDCGGVGKVIFVVSSENVLLSFQPQTKVFTPIGTLSCPATPGSSPFSMAVNRQGTAYVLYDDGNIFRVSTADASCGTSGYQPGQHGFQQFGMGWVSNQAGSSAETLFVIDGSSTASAGNDGLASVDDQGALHPIGNFDMGLSGRSAEVTGLGDGRLFGFFVDINDPSQTSVAEIDKTNAHVLSVVPQSLPQINAWAFAFWGGSFYLFNGTGDSPSRVHKYTPGMGTTQIVDDAGYRIVGAGVSTCAPLTEPPIH